MTTSGETAGRDPLVLLEEIRANVAAAEGMALPMPARRMGRHALRLLAGYDALLKLAAGLEAKSARLQASAIGDDGYDPSSVLPDWAWTGRACAYQEVAADIRSAIAAALTGEEIQP